MPGMPSFAGNLRRSRTRGAAWLAACLCFVACVDAAAVQVPAPTLRDFEPAQELALASLYTQSVNGAGLFDAASDYEIDYPGDWHSRRYVEQSMTRASTSNPAIVATNTLMGDARFGVLRASLTVGARSGVLLSDATVDLWFVDILQIHEDGVLNLNWNPTGSIERKDAASNTFARSFGGATIWILPRTYDFRGGMADALVYARKFFSPETGTTGTNLTDEALQVRAGNVYWVVGQLALGGHARARDNRPPGSLEVLATADFTHTAQLFVDAAAGSSVRFSFASGADYGTPVPLPVPSALLGSSLVLLIGLRRQARERRR
ncbi:MAG: hypothetical protein AB7I32_11410 [Gammaproteobacteria bacterium]